MSVLAIAGTKGGTGKSTLACNLAAMRALAGYRVIVLDTDRQRTAVDWAAFRDDAGYQPRIKVESAYITLDNAQEIGHKGKKLINDVRDADSDYDDVIIDGGGEDSPALRFVMLCTHTMLVPYAPSGPDIWAIANLEDVYRTVSGLGEPGFVPQLFASNVSPLTSERDQIRHLAEAYPGLDFDETTVIYHRAQYRHSLTEGRSIVEMPKPDPKARQELLGLYTKAFGIAFKPQSKGDAA